MKNNNGEEVKESEDHKNTKGPADWENNFMTFKQQVQKNTKDISEMELKIDMSKFFSF